MASSHSSCLPEESASLDVFLIESLLQQKFCYNLQNFEIQATNDNWLFWKAKISMIVG